MVRRFFQFFARIRALLLGRQMDGEFAEEVATHLDLAVQEKMRRGMAQEEARRSALREFGNICAIRETHRETRSLISVDRLSQDLRYAVRQLLRQPALTIVCVVTLAIGIGAITSIFNDVNAVWWKILPVTRPQELRTFSWMASRRGFMAGGVATLPAGATTIDRFSYAAFTAIREHSVSFSDVACWLDLGENQPILINDSVKVLGHAVSGNYFQTLGVQAFIGRVFTLDDERPESTPVAVITYSLWQRTFNADTSLVNHTVNLNAKPYTVIGVLPRGFFGLDSSTVPDVFVPIQTVIPSQTLHRQENWNLCRIAGRLSANTTDDRARAEIAALVNQTILADQPKEPYDPPSITLASVVYGTDNLRRALSTPALIIVVTSGVVFLLVCANVAGLLLAKGASRRKEIATRLALGASRARILRQLITESVLVAMLGGLLGMLFAYTIAGFTPTLVGLLLPSAFGSVRDLGISTVPDLRALGICAAVSLSSTILFGLTPALIATKLDLVSMLKQVKSRTAKTEFRWINSGRLIAFQVAISVLLLVGAGLMLRTVRNLRMTDLGYDPAGLLMFRVEPRLSGYTPDRRLVFAEQALAQFQRIPGVNAASAASIPVLANVNGAIGDLCVEGFASEDPADHSVAFNSITPGYFDMMRMPILSGRDVSWSDRQNTPKVTLINEAFARKYFENKDPIGMQIGGGTCSTVPNAGWRVIGIVRDIKVQPRREVRPTMYLPYMQFPTNNWMTFALRTAVDPSTLLPEVQRTLENIDHDVPILDAVTPVDLRDRMMSRERLLAGFLLCFGTTAVILTALGLYGMLAFSVSQRRTEIGIRMAIGADQGSLVLMIIRESLRPVALGILLGFAGAVALTRYLGSLLFGVSPTDIWTIACVVFLLGIVGIAAAIIPAYNASTVDPLTALRDE